MSELPPKADGPDSAIDAYTTPPPSTCPCCGAGEVFVSTFGSWTEWGCGTHHARGKKYQSDKCTIAQLRQQLADISKACARNAERAAEQTECLDAANARIEVLDRQLADEKAKREEIKDISEALDDMTIIAADLRAKLEAADRQIAELGLEVASHKDAADKAEAKREREVDYACEATKELCAEDALAALEDSEMYRERHKKDVENAVVQIDALTQLLREALPQLAALDGYYLKNGRASRYVQDLVGRIKQAIESEVKS